MMNINQIEPLGINDELQQYYIKLAEKNGFKLCIWNDRPDTKTEIIKRTQDAEVLIVSNIPIDKEILDHSPKLKMISVAFTGVDHIDLDECKKRNIIVKNAAGYSTNSVAELTIGMIIVLLRDIIGNSKRTAKGEGRNGYTGFELKEKKIGIVGMGKIGQEVARLCNAFGCEVLAWNKTTKKIKDIQFVSLETLLNTSDIITLHLPLTQETKWLINSENIKLLKSTAFIINTARGPIIETTALVEALVNNTIAGAALDVYDYEPPLLNDYPLLGLKNVILLPHIAYATYEAFDKRAEIVFMNIFHWYNEFENTEINI